MMKIKLKKPMVENLDMRMAARVAREAVLKEIYLVDAKINRDPLIEVPESLTLEHKCSVEVISSDKEKNLSRILCNFRVDAFNSEVPDKLEMKIEAAFCTSFVDESLPDEPSEDELSDLIDQIDYLHYFMVINPIFQAWPYWREFVQSMSTRMGFPALTVPHLEIALKKAVGKKSKSQPTKKEFNRQEKVVV